MQNLITDVTQTIPRNEFRVCSKAIVRLRGQWRLDKNTSCVREGGQLHFYSPGFLIRGQPCVTSADQALTQAGWQIASQLPGDEHKVSATWVVQRSTQCLPVFLDFDGMDDMECLPLSRSYACHIRDEKQISLYFSKKGEHWKKQLEEFVTALNNAQEE